jgi:transmembrane sensor
MDKNLHMKKITEEEFKNSTMDERILNHASSYEVPSSMTTDEALLKFKARIESGHGLAMPEKSKNLRLIPIILSIAASLLIILGIWFIFDLKMSTSIVVNKGEHKEYNLPDGSKVTINADSKISFKKSHFSDKRKLNMEGEAFFTVQKGNKFTIGTKFGRVTVLGTSFNVYARESAFKVSCVTGKVLVESENKSQVLGPGESSIIVNDYLVKFNDRNINKSIGWRSGEFNFEYTPLNVIFEEISRQYNVTFTTPELNKKYFTGSFSNKNLVETLDIVCIPMGLSYEIGSNGKIHIHEKQY